MENKSNVIVFGGSGFLGSHVSDFLTEKGYNVFIYDKKESPYIQSGQIMIKADILDQAKVRQSIKECDYVYNFSGIADVKEAQDNPIATVKNNVLATAYMLDACREFSIKRFLFASTIYVYSEMGSFYRSSKQSCEFFIENYNKKYGVNYSILRYGSLYGKRANEFNFIRNILRQAILEGKMQRKGNGEEIRDYINVTDAARASVEILDKKEFENSYIMITGSQTIKIKDMLKMIKEIFNSEVKIEYLDERIPEHYEITPYSFRPRVAKKYVLNYYQDLGEGILDAIYDVYKEIHNKGEQSIIPAPKK